MQTEDSPIGNVARVRPIPSYFDSALPKKNTDSPKIKESTIEGLMEIIRGVPIQPKTDIETADWATYINDDIGLEFNYPQEWGVPKIEIHSTPDCVSGTVCVSREDKATESLRISFPNSKFI